MVFDGRGRRRSLATGLEFRVILEERVYVVNLCYRQRVRRGFGNWTLLYASKELQGGCVSVGVLPRKRHGGSLVEWLKNVRYGRGWGKGEESIYNHKNEREVSSRFLCLCGLASSKEPKDKA